MKFNNFKFSEHRHLQNKAKLRLSTVTFGGKSQRSDVYSSCLPNIAKDDPSLAPTPMKIHYLAP